MGNLSFLRQTLNKFVLLVILTWSGARSGKKILQKRLKRRHVLPSARETGKESALGQRVKNNCSSWLASTKTQVWTRRKNLKVWGRVLVVATVKWQEEYTEKIRHKTLSGKKTKIKYKIKKKKKKTKVRQGAHIHQPTAWAEPRTCTPPYHPGSGSNGQLVCPYWGLPAWHSHGTSEILYYRQLHTTHMGAVGWEPHCSSPTACVGKADHELPWSVCQQIQ